MSVNKILSEDSTMIEMCDEEKFEEYQCTNVFVEKEHLDAEVNEAAEETTKAEQEIPAPIPKSHHSEKKTKKHTKKDIMVKWAQKQNEKLKLEIKYMKEEHKLQMEKLKLEIKRLCEG